AVTSSPILTSLDRSFILSLLNSDALINPSIPSSSSRTIPLSLISLTFPLRTVSWGLYLSRASSQGSFVSCLRPSPILWFFSSTPRTTTSISSPVLNSSCGFTLPFHETSPGRISPTKSSSTSTNIPFSVMFLIFPFTLVPGAFFSLNISHGLRSIRLRLSAIRLLSTSTSSTTASTRLPTLTISFGCLNLLVHVISDMCTRPSPPGSISTNTPKSVTETTLPLTFAPGLYFFSTHAHGSDLVCLRLKEIFPSSSIFKTLTLTSSSTETTSPACFTLPHDSSLMGMNPSTPPKSTKAPWSIIFTTLPDTVFPSFSVERTLVRRISLCSSR